MVRRVFFSYHFQEDAWRANQVRNSWVTKRSRKAAGFFDAADQEEVKRASDAEIKRWIDEQLQGTSVTIVLIGEHTASRKYVRYEIEQSLKRGNAILAIRIHNVKDLSGRVGREGSNPLDGFSLPAGSGRRPLSDVFPTYDWVIGDGRNNLPQWIEEAIEINASIPDTARTHLAEETRDEEEGLVAAALTILAVGALLTVGAAVLEEIRRRLRRNRDRYRYP